MEKIDQLELAVVKGFKYDSHKGIIITPKGKTVTKKTLNGYIQLIVRDAKKTFYINGHQFAWFSIYGNLPECIDHINRLKTDNRISNLRVVNKSQNAMNMNNVKGYCFCKRTNKYIAIITLNNKAIRLGSFDTQQEASHCYSKNKDKYHVIN